MTKINREANATIKGFDYQLLLTARMIVELAKKSSDLELTIEGEEDLDINSDLIDLCQFKYYEKTDCSLNTFQEALAYFYCHWNKNRREHPDGYRYHLFVYTKSKFDGYTIEDVKKTLKYCNATKILEKQNISWADNDIEKFYKKFEFKHVESYSKAMEQLSNDLSKYLGTSMQETEIIYTPNLLSLIHMYAIKETPEERTVPARALMDKLCDEKMQLSRHYILNNINGHKIQETIVRKIKSIYLESFNQHVIVCFGRKWSKSQIVNVINQTVGNFAEIGCKTNNEPLTFGLTGQDDALTEIKRKLLKSSSYVFNDGFESIYFSPQIFNMDPMVTRRGSKYTKLSYNYRISSIENLWKAWKEKKKALVIAVDCNVPNFITQYIEIDEFDSDTVTAVIRSASK